jgi:hypothetical protein
MSKFLTIAFLMLNVFTFQANAYEKIKSLDAESTKRAFEEKMQRTDSFFENVSNDVPEQALYDFRINLLTGYNEVFLSPRPSIKEYFEELSESLTWITHLKVQDD